MTSELSMELVEPVNKAKTDTESDYNINVFVSELVGECYNGSDNSGDNIGDNNCSNMSLVTDHTASEEPYFYQ